MKFIFAVVALVVVASARLAVEPEMIEQINSMQNAWKAGENHITKMSLEDAKSLLGVNLIHMKPLPFATLPVRADPPEAFDSRTNWPQCETMYQIRDQRHCGSCWAFGAVEAMTDRLCIVKGEHTPLSAEDMNSCSGCGDCNGGYPSCAWSYWRSTGVVSEDCYPYTAGTNSSEIVTPPCLRRCTYNTSKSWATDKHLGASAYSVSGEKNMMNEIFTNGPAECVFTVYNDFMSYTSGVYYHVTGAQLGGHAVKMLGWGVENGMKYWLCANSWNTSWGDKGYFKIRKGTNECGIESAIYAGLPK